jgi:thiamine-monophosphate kinase
VSAPGEFDLIAKYFSRPARRAVLGVGDDAALLAPRPGFELAISTDMLVEGTHFLPLTNAERLGHKTLAVNLSDLAAMGAQPLYATLAVSLPRVDEAWLAAFARGFFALADAHGVELIGGDTTRGPLNLCVTIMGEVPAGAAIRRAGARAGDDVWVSGTLGDAALGLAQLQGGVILDAAAAAHAINRLEAPMPRVALGLALRGLASSMLDVSDGLVGDLAHIARASQLAARVNAEALPLSLDSPLRAMPLDARLRYAAGGGDDYELCFTAPPAQSAAVRAAGASAGVPLTKIGTMIAPAAATGVAAGVVLVVDGDGNPCTPTVSGYDHFGMPV